MAHDVIVTKLIDGPRAAIFHVYIRSDGVSPDLVNQVIIDPTVDLTPALTSLPSMTVDHLWYDIVGFSGELRFDDLLTDSPIWVMSPGNGVDIDFSHFGGFKDRSTIDGNGKLKLTTVGLSAAGSKGCFTIRIKK